MDVKDRLHQLMQRPGFQARTDQESLLDGVKEIDRLRAALKQIAACADEENEWDGRDRFRNVRGYAQRILAGETPIGVEQAAREEKR